MPADSNYAQPDLVNTARGGCNFTESRFLLVPEGAPVTSANLSAALFQISAIAKVLREVIQAIRSLAWLLDEMEEDTMASTARDAVNAQLEYMNEELRLLTDHFRTTLSAEVDKQMEIMVVTTKTLEARISNLAPYGDAILGHTKAPEGADPRVIAQVGIRSRQFILDFPQNQQCNTSAKRRCLNISMRQFSKPRGKVRQISRKSEEWRN